MNDLDVEKILFACRLAVLAHGNQKRKYSDDPYAIHPITVAITLIRNADPKYTTTDNICAALLHDVIEDCGVTRERIEEQFGSEVARIVYELTNKSKPEDGNRAARKAIDRDFLETVSPEAKTIKCADIYHNTFSIVKNDEDFAKVYLSEIRDLMPRLIGGCPMLWKSAFNIFIPD